jgi:hypothetical protein
MKITSLIAGSMRKRRRARMNRDLPKACVAPSRRANYAACLAALSMFALSGCAAVKVKLGIRVYLSKVQVTSVQASLLNGPAIAPGEKSPLIVQFTQPDGKVLVTEGKGKGKVMWQDLTVTPTVVTANNKGVLTLAHDPRKSDGKTAHVTITVPSHPDLKADLDIPITYDYNFVSNFSGARGSDGLSGSDGMAGSSGSMGSTDPNNPSPGGNGGNGTKGGDGGDGPPVQVRVTLRPGAHPLLQASVAAAGKTRLYLIDPQGGALTVTADGGAGGSGGRGGRGGAGGSGGIGTPAGSSGMAGSDGRNGFDGSPGRGGSITMTYDPQVKPYLNIIHLSNKGGPASVFNEAPVAPLW